MLFPFLLTAFLLLCEFSEKLLIFVIERRMDVKGERLRFKNEIRNLKNQRLSLQNGGSVRQLEAVLGKIKKAYQNRKVDEQEIKDVHESVRIFCRSLVRSVSYSISGFCLLTQFGRTMIILESEWLSPAEQVFSFPNDVEGTIAILPWFLIVTNAAKALKNE